MSIKRIKVARLDDLKEGQIKAFKADDKKILLTKIGGKIYATGAACPHYGAPLEKGILSGDHVICPWHHARFNVKSGGLVEPPARDALTSFDVEIEGEDIYVQIP